MKLSLTSAFHYILFALALLVTAPKMIDLCDKVKEVKAVKVEKELVAKENTAEILHSEILFRY